jgi:2-polyprenyl-3-methyl-5-hydroxy-6-metoxy-1,4-benzoquinol methylase
MIRGELEYNKYCDYFLKKLFKSSKKWYLPNSGLWGERYMKEIQSILTEERSRKEFNIIKRYIDGKNKKILDAPCGYGRISNLLGAAGYNVTGVDINAYFVDIAKKGADKKRLAVNYLIKDIFSFNPKNKYDVVLNIFTSIGYFESDDKNEFFIKKICDLVRSGGTLILETINPFGVLKRYKNKEVSITNDGTKIVQERFFDPKTSTNIERITDYYPNGKIFKGLHCVRFYYPHELIKICEKYGLKNVDILDGNGRKKNLLNTIRMWLIFKK